MKQQFYNILKKMLLRLKQFINLNKLFFYSYRKHKEKEIKKYLFFRYRLLTYVLLNPFWKVTDRYFLRFRVFFKKASKFVKTDDVRFPNNTTIYFINLSHRQDRLFSIMTELSRMEITNFKRFEAIKRTPGMMGCTLSHIETLVQSKDSNKPLVMILEDDAIFNVSRRELDKLINEFYNDPKLDVLCLGFNSLNNVSYNDFFDISNNIQTASCYIIKEKFISEVIEVFNLAYILQLNNVDELFGSALDVVWKRLQRKLIFVTPKFHVVTQIPSISDTGLHPHFVNHGV